MTIARSGSVALANAGGPVGLTAVPNPRQIDMLNLKGMRFPIDVILVCIRWYAAYPLSYRHLEE